MFPRFFQAHPFLHGIWIIYYVICMVIATCAFGVNFIPIPSKLPRRSASVYLFIYDMIAFCGCRWIGNNPVFEDDFVVIRKKIRHGVRNWRQERYDAAYRSK